MTKTITINGVEYDAQTGLRLASTHVLGQSSPKTPLHRGVSAHAAAIHTTTQRSQRLQRKYTKKPATPAQAQRTTTPIIHKKSTMNDIKTTTNRSPQIHKFAPSASRKKNSVPHMSTDIAPKQHPVAARAHHKQQKAHPQTTHHSAQEIKKHVIHTALANAATNTTELKTPLRKRVARRMSLASGGLAVVLLVGYLTYVTVPSVSVRVAAMQAGIDASYPAYHPDGYRLNGPVAYDNGSVQLLFKANGGAGSYTLQQQKSSWDTTALLENYVQPQAETDYIAYNDSGITVYTYGSSAAWVNGGILYTLDSTAQLSNEQIRKIATSL